MKFPEDSEFICVDHFDEALFLKVLDWVGDSRRAAFISDVPKESPNPRVKIYHLESIIQKNKILKEIAWSAVLEPIHVIGERFKEEIETNHLAAHLILSEAADYWVKPLQNARANSGPFRRGLELEGAFKNIPAIIVGAGPSLEKNGHLLKELKDRALIFAGGSALNVIDVEPHFAASIDAEAPYEQFQKHRYKETAFCYQARMDSDNFREMRGEKLLFPDSSSSAINWLYGEDGLFDGGWTVGNFLTQIALLAGCSPIIFVGMDLCYDGDRKYARLENEAQTPLIEVGGASTQRDWLMAAMWTREKAEGRDFINATEGGILGLKEQPLKHFLDALPKRELSVEGVIDKLNKSKPILWDVWDESLRNCKKGVEQHVEDPVYNKLLLPLWQIWKPIFQREVDLDPKQNLELHKRLFFQNVLVEHG